MHCLVKPRKGSLPSAVWEHITPPVALWVQYSVHYHEGNKAMWRQSYIYTGMCIGDSVWQYIHVAQHSCFGEE